LGKGGGGRPRGSPRSRFDGLEGAWEGPAGQFGGARRRPPRRRKNFRRAGADSGNARQGRRPWGTREVRWRLDGDKWTGRARSPSSSYGGRRRREAAGGEKLVRRGRSSGRLLFMVDMRASLATTCAPTLTRRTACPRPARVGRRRRTGGQRRARRAARARAPRGGARIPGVLGVLPTSGSAASERREGPNSEAGAALTPTCATRDAVARHRPAQSFTVRQFERLDLRKVE
jgi:hypothetical protein